VEINSQIHVHTLKTCELITHTQKHVIINEIVHKKVFTT
jgi:hypothetical protein